MKTTIYFFLGLLALSSCDLEYPRACAAFTCSNEQETASGTCGTRNDTLVTWGKCPAGEFCVEDPYVNTEYFCNYGNLAPGTLVSDKKMCKSNKLANTNTSSSCAGIAAKGGCTSDMNCGVNLYCSNKICTPVIADGGNCTSKTAQCSSRAYCVNKTCVLIGSLPVGANNTELQNAACSTNWVDFTTKKCAQGWTLGSNVTQPKEGGLCNITYQGKPVVDYANWQPYRYARCEYREDGQAVCQKGPGDYHTQFAAVSKYIQKYKPNCHVSYRNFWGLCNIDQSMSEYKDLFQQMMEGVVGTQLLGVPKCVQTEQSWMWVNYFKNAPNPTSGASATAVSAIALIGALFIVAL